MYVLFVRMPPQCESKYGMLLEVFLNHVEKSKAKLPKYSTYFFLLGIPTYDLPFDLKIGDI